MKADQSRSSKNKLPFASKNSEKKVVLPVCSYRLLRNHVPLLTVPLWRQDAKPSCSLSNLPSPDPKPERPQKLMSLINFNVDPRILYKLLNSEVSLGKYIYHSYPRNLRLWESPSISKSMQKCLVMPNKAFNKIQDPFLTSNEFYKSIDRKILFLYFKSIIY